MLSLAAFLVATLFVCLLTYLNFKYWTTLRDIKGPVPSIVGNQFQFNVSNLHEGFYDWTQKFGKVFKCWIFNQPVLVISDLNLVKDIMVINNRPKSKFFHAPLVPIIGNEGLFLGEGSSQRERKRLIMPSFHTEGVKAMVPAMNSVISALNVHLHEAAKTKEPVNISDLIMRAALDIIGKVAFTLEFNSVNKRKDGETPSALENIPAAIAEVLKELNLRVTNPFRKYTHPFANKRYHELLRQMRAFALQFISERRKNTDTEYKDILEGLMSGELEDSAVVDEFLTLGTGYETSGVFIIFALSSILSNKDVYTKVKQELDEVLGNSELTWDAVNNMNYLHAVCRETLRLFPVGPHSIRESVTTEKIGPYTVPPKTILLISTYIIHRDGDIWDEPLKFKPERFLNDSLGYKHTPEHTPCSPFLAFSLGPRSCVAQQFGMMEAKTVLAGILHKFDLQAAPNCSADVGVRCKIILKPENDLIVTVSQKN